MSEALRLAQRLEILVTNEQDHQAAAAELRRLHDLLGKANALCRIRADRIKKLEALNAELVEALKEFADWYDERSGDNECRPLENARAALAKVGKSK